MKNTKIITLGIATVVASVLLPVASTFAASDSKNTVINAQIQSVITLSVDSSVTITATPGVADGVGTANATAAVSTNNTAGYTLSIKDADANTNLTSATASANIAAHSGTFGAPTALGANTWGYRLATFGSDTYAGITASDVELKQTSTTASNDQTVVTFGMKVDATQKSANDYTDTVTFTAVTR